MRMYEGRQDGTRCTKFAQKNRHCVRQWKGILSHEFFHNEKDNWFYSLVPTTNAIKACNSKASGEASRVNQQQKPLYSIATVLGHINLLWFGKNLCALGNFNYVHLYSRGWPSSSIICHTIWNFFNGVTLALKRNLWKFLGPVFRSEIQSNSTVMVLREKNGERYQKFWI